MLSSEMLVLLRKKVTSRTALTTWLSPFRVRALLSSSTTHESQFAAVQYLISSCGLPSDKALRASKYISHLKSPQKPDAALQFLRQSGVTEHHIRAAALRQPSFLRYSVDKCFKPRMAELLHLGFSPPQISLLFSLCPTAFKLIKLPQKIQFWMQILGSVDSLLLSVKHDRFLITSNHENTAIPNISFLREQCGFSVPQISRLIKSAPRAIRSSPQALRIQAKRAEELGVSRSSPMFVYALITVSSLNQKTIDARLSNLTSLGLSQQEVITIVRRLPLILKQRDEVIRCKIMFLTKEVGCDNLCLVRHPALPTYSLEKRLIPRNFVRKVLLSKGLPVANKIFYSFMKLTEKDFVEKFVLPYEVAIPGLHRAYVDACAGNIEGLNWFDRYLQV